MSAASIFGRVICNETSKLQPPQSTVNALTNTIVSHLKANRLQKAVSILFASPFSVPYSLYADLFKLCSSSRAVEEARKVESHLVTFSPTPPIFLLNRAIETYGKCGCIAYAQEVFDQMPQRDGGSWNAIITAHTQCGSPEKALYLFKDMKSTGFHPNQITFASVLGSCGDVLALSFSRQIHGLIVKHGFNRNVILGSALVDVYGKCNSMNESRSMFDEIENPNDVTWNVIIRRYLESGNEREAVTMFNKMFQTDLRPLSFTFSSAISACTAISALKEGMQIHGAGIKLNISEDKAVSSTLCNMYAKCGEIESARVIFDQPGSRDLVSWTSIVSAYAMNGRAREARELFDKMPEKNSVSWNAMLKGYIHSLQWEKALEFVYLMLKKSNNIDYVTLGLLLNVCSGLLDLDKGKQVHGFIYRHGFSSNILVGNALLDMYGKCGNIKSARVWFSQMSKSRDSVSWNSLLTSYAKHQQSEEAILIFGEMKWETKPSKFTFGILLAACANVFALAQGKQIHGFMIRNGYKFDNVITGVLLDMYSKCNCLDYALRVFRDAGSRDSVLYNSIILGCFYNKRSIEVLELFQLMEKEGIKPDHVTFQGILLACLYEGNVELAMEYFDSMVDRYCVIPRLEHFECMIELFCRFGCVNELENFVKGMPFDLTVPMLTRVLDACKENRWLSLGKWAAEKLDEMK